MPRPASEPTTPAARVRAARLAAGLTQEQAGAKLGVSGQYLSDVERGMRAPSLDWLHAAALALGCDPSALDERLAPTK